MPRILVVDDDAETCHFMRELLCGPGREIETAERPDQALALLEAGFDLVISDIHLNADRSGLDLLRAFKAKDPAVEVVLLSGFGTLETAIEAVRAGAFDYVSKPIDIAQLKEVVERALSRRGRTDEPLPSPPSEPFDPSPDGLVGRSASMLAVYKQVALASASRAPVLVTGETGTGKELVARALHRHGPRSARPFVAVNCGAFAEGLLESELFGHVRGAFTGAVGDKRPGLQVRLLRVLEAGDVRPVGGSRALKVDVRAIAATHRDLERAVAEGTFRQDLYYRLNVFRIALPPLRERREDIPMLAARVLRKVGEQTDYPVRLTPSALQSLVAYAWPGNVRELENTLESLAVAAPGGVIDASDLPSAFQGPPPALEQPLFAGLPTLEEMEKRYLRHVVAAVGGNRSRAAQVLGIDRRTLYRMAERLALDLEKSEQ